MGSISAVLPVSFVSVTATRNMNVILIEWQANNEINVDHYEVEGSEDGRRFSKPGSYWLLQVRVLLIISTQTIRNIPDNYGIV